MAEQEEDKAWRREIFLNEFSSFFYRVRVRLLKKIDSCNNVGKAFSEFRDNVSNSEAAFDFTPDGSGTFRCGLTSVYDGVAGGCACRLSVVVREISDEGGIGVTIGLEKLYARRENIRDIISPFHVFGVFRFDGSWSTDFEHFFKNLEPVVNVVLVGCLLRDSLYFKGYFVMQSNEWYEDNLMLRVKMDLGNVRGVMTLDLNFNPVHDCFVHITSVSFTGFLGSTSSDDIHCTTPRDFMNAIQSKVGFLDRKTLKATMADVRRDLDDLVSLVGRRNSLKC